jgi:hypothetical protein
MMRVVDLARVRRALVALDELAQRFPRLRGPTARRRLAEWLDQRERSSESGNRDGNEEAQQDHRG